MSKVSGAGRAVVGVLLLASCGGGEAPPAASTGPVVRIAASDTLGSILVPKLVETHQRTVGNLGFEVSPATDGHAFEALLTGKADLAAVARPPTHAEAEQAHADGWKLDDGARHILGVSVIAVTVHPTNMVDSLTYDQVIGIFCTGTVDNWSFLGLDDAPIRPVAHEPTSGTRAVFEDFFCGPKGLHPRVDVLSTEEINAVLKDDATAISFQSLAEVSSAKVVGLRPDAGGHPVLPSQQNVIRGSYPLYHDVYVYAKPAEDTPGSKFVSWIESPAGQDVVDETRFVPLFLRPERMDDPRPLRETIHFEPGSSEPNQRSSMRLQLLVEELRDRSGEYRHIVLEGYTDNQEPDGEKLATARAEKVRDALAKELPGMFFEIIPRGAANPIAPNTTPYGRQQNRRVQVYLADEEKEEPAAAAAP
jgi:phosphate transport system substrate-binding protein